MKSPISKRILEFILVAQAILIFSFVQAQNWAWEGGQSVLNQLGNYGMQGVPNNNNCPGARKAAVTWTDTSNNLWLFGGIGYDKNGAYGRLNDLWKYNPITKEWTWVHGKNLIEQFAVYGTKNIPSSTNCPSARQDAASVLGADGNLWLWGGEGLANGYNGYLNDLWKYDIANNTWTWVSGDTTPDVFGVYGIQNTPTSFNKPGTRASSLMFEYNNEIWVIGGYGKGINGANGSLSDVWKYNNTTGLWTWVKGPQLTNRPGVYGTCGLAATTNTPGGRSSHVGWLDNFGNIWLMAGLGYSGAGQYGYLNDLWKYNIASNEWTWIKGDNAVHSAANYGTLGLGYGASNPGARSKSISWIDQYGHLWLFGGYGQVSSVYGQLNDLWQYNPSTNEWTWMGGNNAINEKGVYGAQNIPSVINKPGARESAMKWVDNNGNFWLMAGFGFATGSTISGLMNDLWKYTPNQVPQLALPIHNVFCGNTTNFSIPITVQDLDNDSISFSIILDTTILSSVVNFTHLGGDNYLLTGTLTGLVGTTTCMLLAIDEHGASDFSAFDIEIPTMASSRASYEMCFGDSVLVAGRYIKNDGVYQDTIAGYNGCDSLVISNVTVLPVITNILYDTILESEFYLFAGDSLTASGIYTDTLLAWTGCDSVIALDLNVIPINTTITSTANTPSYFKIYPNPSNGQFSLVFKIEHTQYYQLIITDALGRIVYENQENNIIEPEFQKDILFDFNSLNSGIYMARLVTENGLWVEKMQIIKQ